MNNKKFTQDYINYFSKKINESDKDLEKFNDFFQILNKYQEKNKVHIFGNGGSASIASHFSMDLTNNSNIKCLNYNDAAIITCFSNDYGFNNWIDTAIKQYGNKNDLLILISSSGKSKNMLNAIKAAKKKKFNKIITLTGFKKNNPLKKKGDLNLWVDSNKYNIIENIHQFWLLMMVDMVNNFSKKK